MMNFQNLDARTLTIAILSTMALMLPVSQPRAQTTISAVWHRKALGQTQHCSRYGVSYPFTWPNNNNWSQVEKYGDPCSNSELLMIEPSNWSIPGVPNGPNYEVFLGSAGGAPVNLDVYGVIVHSLTIQPDGGLNMTFGSSLQAYVIDIQRDGEITMHGGGGLTPVLALAPGGTMLKSGGDGTFAIDPWIALQSEGGRFQVNSGKLV
ncbi:MAG TPA: hypothetical protein VEC99_03930, partial [Clostridia bacterium]|nr:hypothetical protein [Clostridia bacterium]